MPFLLVMRLLIMVQRVSRHVMVTVVLQVSSTTQGIMSVTRMGFMVHFTVTVMPIVSNYPACDNLTANICKDGITCNGGLSCANTTVETIYRGCNAELGCWKAGYQGGYVGSIIGSCNDAKIGCFLIASYGGYVNQIIDSCNNGYQTCGLNAKGLPQLGYGGGNITSIRDSCNNGTYTCATAALGGGYVPSIEDSCNKDRGCSSIAKFGGSIDGGIKSSCNEKASCVLAGALSCVVCGFDPSGIINSTIDDCCNCSYECYGANETTLPESCQAGVLPATCAPTFSPTSSPSGSVSLSLLVLFAM